MRFGEDATCLSGSPSEKGGYMFWRKQKPAWDQKNVDFHFAIRNVYEYGLIRLALARASYFVGHNVTVGEKALETTTFDFTGVVHEEGLQESHISCDVEFNDAPVDNGAIGQCVLSELSSHGPSNRERIEKRPLMLQVTLFDPDRTCRLFAYNAMRDAAISGKRFMHLEIKTDRVDEAEAIRSLREKGYGPPQRIHHLRFFSEIILPNAPSWGLKRGGNF
jgi:hypothetical protein